MEQLEAELSSERQLRKDAEAQSASKSRQLWLLREQLCKLTRLHEELLCAPRRFVGPAVQPPCMPEGLLSSSRGAHAVAVPGPALSSEKRAATASPHLDAGSQSDQVNSHEDEPPVFAAAAQPASAPSADAVLDTPGSSAAQTAGALPVTAKAACDHLQNNVHELQRLQQQLQAAAPDAAARIAKLSRGLEATRAQLADACSAAAATADAGGAGGAGADDGGPGGAADGGAGCDAYARLFSGAACPEPTELGWWYIDDDGTVRGAWDAATMIRWHARSFLQPQLPVCGVSLSMSCVSEPHRMAVLAPPPPEEFTPLAELLQLVVGGGHYTPVPAAGASPDVHSPSAGADPQLDMWEGSQVSSDDGTFSAMEQAARGETDAAAVLTGGGAPAQQMPLLLRALVGLDLGGADEQGGSVGGSGGSGGGGVLMSLLQGLASAAASAAEAVQLQPSSKPAGGGRSARVTSGLQDVLRAVSPALERGDSRPAGGSRSSGSAKSSGGGSSSGTAQLSPALWMS